MIECGQCEKLKAEILALKAKLEAPLSDAEWQFNSFQCEAEHIGKLVAERVDVEDLLAQRAKVG